MLVSCGKQEEVILVSVEQLDEADLKKHGLKITMPRVNILNILAQSQDQHLSAEAIYNLLLEMGEEVGLATVYRVLAQFEAAGLVIKHHFGNEHAVYELDNGEHHDHIVCVKCQKVSEFCDPVIEAQQRAIAKKLQYHLTHHSLQLYGLCQDCSNI